MDKTLIDDFIEYAKTFEVSITVKKSSDYDTFDTIFGDFIEEKGLKNADI